MTPTSNPQPAARPVLIHRQLSLTLPAFDLLKTWQRYWEAQEDRRITNSEVLSRLILTNPTP